MVVGRERKLQNESPVLICSWSTDVAPLSIVLWCNSCYFPFAVAPSSTAALQGCELNKATSFPGFSPWATRTDGTRRSMQGWMPRADGTMDPRKATTAQQYGNQEWVKPGAFVIVKLRGSTSEDFSVSPWKMTESGPGDDCTSFWHCRKVVTCPTSRPSKATKIPFLLGHPSTTP